MNSLQTPSATLPEGRVPGWLAQVAEVLCDVMGSERAEVWARRVAGELERLDGVPFSVVHDWHASGLGPLTAEASARRGGDAAAHQAVRLLHLRALAGEQVAEPDWRSALEPALREVYRHAYAYAEAYATASGAARAFALSRGYDEIEATEYGETYAGSSTEANVRAHADANALAVAAATAAAFAAADATAYAATYPFAQVQACLRAHAELDVVKRQEVGSRLADGLADCLARAGVGAPA
ncbi:SpcZ [Streptacidiphilus sp. EB129]|uniref:SpcZ n=1 Tax=Streptacidiphilus sp. EB129 TaxID=3156262 RepID=UPI003515C605